MTNRTKSDREIKLTAALYVKLGVLRHVRATGHLPEKVGNPGASIAVRLLLEERGTDITLTPDEQLVYDAIARDGRLPGGSVCLVDETQEQHADSKEDIEDG